MSVLPKTQTAIENSVSTRSFLVWKYVNKLSVPHLSYAYTYTQTHTNVYVTRRRRCCYCCCCFILCYETVVYYSLASAVASRTACKGHTSGWMIKHTHTIGYFTMLFHHCGTKLHRRFILISGTMIHLENWKGFSYNSALAFGAVKRYVSVWPCTWE